MAKTRVVNLVESSITAKFASISVAASMVGADSSHISKVANGTRNSAGGFRWSYGKTLGGKTMTIRQRDKFTGDIVAVYSDLETINRLTGMNLNRLYNSLNTGRAVSGYLFETNV